MLNGPIVSTRMSLILSGINLVPMTLMSRQPTENVYVNYTWSGRELPDTQDITISDTITGLRRKKIYLVKQAQSVDPKEGDDILLQFGWMSGADIRYTIKRLDIGFNRYEFRCDTIFNTSSTILIPDDAQSSILKTILAETVTGLGTLALKFNNVLVPIVNRGRKAAKVIQDVDPTMQINVSGSALIDSLTWFAYPNTVKMTYQIDITIITPDNFNDQANIAAYAKWRQDIRHLFGSNKHLVYSSPVWDTNIKMGDFDDRSQMDRNYDVSVATIEVITTEPGS